MHMTFSKFFLKFYIWLRYRKTGEIPAADSNESTHHVDTIVLKQFSFRFVITAFIKGHQMARCQRTIKADGCSA